MIHTQGDWKIGGFSFLTSLTAPDGSPTPWSFPDYDPSLPPALSRSFDFMAPEYAIDEQLLPANDLYALGCVVYAAHSKGDPPFRNRNSIQNLRQNSERLATSLGSSSFQRLSRDVRGGYIAAIFERFQKEPSLNIICLLRAAFAELLSSLFTRFPGSRLTASTFQTSTYFNNILVSTLKFLERDSFAARTKEEKAQFLKGLLKILPQFSDRLSRRKVSRQRCTTVGHWQPFLTSLCAFVGPSRSVRDHVGQDIAAICFAERLSHFQKLV